MISLYPTENKSQGLIRLYSDTPKNNQIRLYSDNQSTQPPKQITPVTLPPTPSALPYFYNDLQNTFGGTIKTLADLQSNPLNTKDVGINDAGKTFKQAGTSVLGALISSSADENKRAADFINTFKKPTSLSEKIGAGLKVLSGGANVIFSPISAVFAGADKLPVLGSIAKLINLPFSVAGETGSKAADNALNALPIPQKTKDNIRQGVDEIGALAMQILVGKAGDIVMKNTLPSERAATAMHDAIIKDNPHLTDQISRVPTNTINSLAKDYGVTDAKTIITQAAEVARNKMQTKTLPSLAQEAQKAVAEGKTVEEFIKGQTPVYRGGGKLGTDITKATDMGISVSTDKKIAQSFMGGESGLIGKSRVDELYIKPDAKILSIQNDPSPDKTLRQLIQQWNVADGSGLDNAPYEKAIVAYAKKNGFDAVDLTHLGEKEIRVVNPDVLQTKSQLTDFYNQAKPSPLAQEAGKYPNAEAFVNHIDIKQGVSPKLKEEINKIRGTGKRVNIGTVGDYLLNPSARAAYKDFLDTPLIVNDKLKTIGGWSNKGEISLPTIGDINGRGTAIIHELEHIKQQKLGEVFNEKNLPYRLKPSEIAARNSAKYHTDSLTKSQLTTAFNETKGAISPAQKAVIEKYPEILDFKNTEKIIPLKLDGKIVGGIDATRSRFNPQRLDIHYVRIIPEAQGKGIGTKAINQLFKDNPDINELVGHATKESKSFWQKQGASFSGSENNIFTIKRSQLTDLWKANQSKGLSPLAQKTIDEQIARSQKTGVTLTSGINPGIDKFIEQDIKPATQGIIGGIAKTWDTIKKTFAPATRGEEALKTASIMRESLGKMSRNKEMVFNALNNSRKVFDTYTKEQSVDFINRLETGQKIPGAEQFTATMREALDNRWRKIQDIKGTDAYIKDYFPHIWKDPAKTEALWQSFGRRPLEGTKAYLKQRTIPTIAEGIKLGLEPLSYNPVDLVASRVADMDKFLMAHDVWTQFKEQGLRKFVKISEKPPEGWIQVNDKISRSFQFSPTEKGMILRGNWYMPEKAATIVNNYLSPGLGNNPIYQAFRMVGNDLNQVQLGLSGFHALFTSGDVIVSKGSLELQKGNYLKAITSPLNPKIIWNNLVRGNKLLTDYYKQNPEIPQMVDALERAGGRVKMDSFYLNNSVDNFLKALRGENYPGALIRSPGALIEAIARPIMQELVPRQKLGVFADGATYILDQAKKEGWSEYKVTLRLQEHWDSVDNRMGQLVYDNLFWNKVIKDFGMVATRSLGWNLGSIREVIGGLKDIAKIPLQLLTEKERANIRMTPKMAYTITLPYTIGVWGSIIYYLYNGSAPKTLLDIYYPKTGKQKPDGTDERISLPSYMKDVFAVAREPSQTIYNKLHPEISAIIAMLQNKDYYGTEIRNGNDPLVKQVKDTLMYQAKQFVPFTINNLIQRQKTGGSWTSYLQSFAGITPAPGYITRSPLQTEIYDLYDKRFGGGIRTQESTDQSRQKSEIRTLYLLGKTDEANQKLKEAMQSGLIKNSSQFIQEADIPNDVKLFRKLPTQDQEALIKKMELFQLNRYAWYVAKDIKNHFSSLSDNTKNFVEMTKRGEIKEPVWKRGQIIP